MGCLAGSVEHGTLGLGVAGSSPMLGVETAKKINFGGKKISKL